MSSKFSLKNLLDTKSYGFTDNLQIKITDSHIIIAATNDVVEDGKYKSSIKVMKLAIAEI